MARVYRPTYTKKLADGTVEVRQVRHYYAVYRDAQSGKLRRVRAFADEHASLAYAFELEKKSALRAAGLLPDGAAPGVPLVGLIAEYEAHLRDSGVSEKHHKQAASRLRKAIEGASFRVAGDVRPGPLRAYFARRIADPEDRFGHQSANHYLAAARAFCAWLVGRGVMVANPLAGFELFNVEVDRRHVRRVLTPEQFDHLIATVTDTPAHKKRLGLEGPDRAVLYLLAAWTGLRAGELASLTPASFTLGEARPRVELEARRSKRRRLDLQPLPGWLAELFAEWLAGRPAGERLFPKLKSSHNNAVNAIRADLADAGIPYADARGRVYDFHSLRCQFATNLARLGVPLTQAQRLMRHSTPDLTSNVYTHLDIEELGALLDREGPPDPRPA